MNSCCVPQILSSSQWTDFHSQCESTICDWWYCDRVTLLETHTVYPSSAFCQWYSEGLFYLKIRNDGECVHGRKSWNDCWSDVLSQWLHQRSCLNWCENFSIHSCLLISCVYMEFLQIANTDKNSLLLYSQFLVSRTLTVYIVGFSHCVKTLLH